VDPVTLILGLGGLGAAAAAGWYRRRARRAELRAAELAVELRLNAYAASHDSLTGLPNRRAFYDRGADLLAARDNLPLVGVLLDLDGFKDVNDVLGHAVGDQVLAVLGERMSAFSSDGLVARLGGDEFAALFSGTAAAPSPYQAISRLVAAIAEPIHVAGHEIRVTASAGVCAVHRPTPLAEVLADADAMMYRAKATARREASIRVADVAGGGDVVHADFGTGSEPVPRRTGRRHTPVPAGPDAYQGLRARPAQ
jgi:diguanylate cyclase (GGDEF)-like protein